MIKNFNIGEIEMQMVHPCEMVGEDNLYCTSGAGVEE